MTLERLPYEILHAIFQWLGPRELLFMVASCRRFRELIQDNSKLWHDVYIRVLDPPAVANLDWELELQNVARLENICRRATVALKV